MNFWHFQAQIYSQAAQAISGSNRRGFNAAFLRETDPHGVFYVPCVVWGGVSVSFVGLIRALKLAFKRRPFKKKTWARRGSSRGARRLTTLAGPAWFYGRNP